MPHGTPDFGIASSKTTTYALADIAELAARIGSIVTFDRRGDIVWLDDFENGITKWSISAGTTGSSIAISTARARNGANSALLTGGSDGSFQVSMAHQHALQVASKLGMEISFHIVGTIKTLLFTANYFDGVNVHTAEFEWVQATEDLVIKDESDADVVVASSIGFSTLASMFNTLKLVYDIDTGKYVRLIVNNVTYDISATSFQVTANDEAPRVNVVLTLTSRSGQNDTTYVDDVIITQNEP